MAIHDDAICAYLGNLPYKTQWMDNTPNARNGTLVGSATWQADTTTIKRPYIDSPAGAHYATASFSPIVLDAFSVSAWVKVPSWSTNAPFVFASAVGNDWNNDSIFWLHMTGTGQIRFRAANQNTTSSAGVMPLNEWVHIGASRAASNQTHLYVNGVLAASGTMTGTRTMPAITVGYQYQLIAFVGQYADVAVWDRILSPAEFDTLAKPSYRPLATGSVVTPHLIAPSLSHGVIG